MRDMNALSEDFWGGMDTKTAEKGGLSVRNTHWGFIARQDGRSFEASLETLLKVVGLSLVPIGCAMMFMIREIPLSGLLLADVGLPIAFVVIGLALFLHASRGFRREVQVDAENRQVRIGVANSAGSFRCHQTLAAREIDSAFLLRSRTPGRPSSLNLRLRGSSRPMMLLEGAELALQPVFERTAEALKTPKARKPKAKTTARRRSLMSIPLWKKRAQNFD